MGNKPSNKEHRNRVKKPEANTSVESAVPNKGLTDASKKVRLGLFGALLAAGVAGMAINQSSKPTEADKSEAISASTPERNSGEKSTIHDTKTPEIPTSLALPKNNYTRIELPANQAAGNDFQAMIDYQERWKQVALDALNRFATNPKVPPLIEHFKQNGQVGLPMGQQAIQIIYKDKDQSIGGTQNQLGFAMVFMPVEFAVNMQSPVLAQYNSPPITVRVAGDITCEEWLAILLLHELQHVYDLQVNKENPHNESEYLMGEVNAHKFENELLREWGPDAYDFFVGSAKKIFLDSKGGNLDMIDRLIYQIYPMDDMHPRISGVTKASAYMAFLFEIAKDKNFSDEEMQKLYKAIGVDFGNQSPSLSASYNILTAPKGF